MPTSASSSRPNGRMRSSRSPRTRGLRWLTLDDAIDLAAEDNLRTTLERVGELFVAV